MIRQFFLLPSINRSMLGVGLVWLLAVSSAVAQLPIPHDLQIQREKQRLAAEEAAAEAANRDSTATESDGTNEKSVPKMVMLHLKLLRSANSSPQQRSVAAEKLLGLGEPGIRSMMREVSRDFDERIDDYLSDFREASRADLKSRWKGDIESEIEQLREAVRSTARHPDLTKDMIVRISDPAMERLEALLATDRETVLDGDGDLVAQREMLLDFAAFWHRGRAMMKNSAADVGEAPPKRDDLDEQLRLRESLAAKIAMPMPERDMQILIDNGKLAAQLPVGEAEGIAMLNAKRVRAGLGALAIDLKLCEAGRDHSKDMKTKGFFSHTSPVPGKKSPGDRAKRAGTTGGGENIYYGSSRVDGAIKAWWYSPGHHKNMMNAGYGRIGLGNYQTHWTQMFGRGGG